MKKRVLSLSLALAMAASLTACGSSSSTTETTAAAAADATTAAAGASSEASSDKGFKIGGIGPVTGAAAVYGLAVKNGAQIAVDEINADGGINGYQIEFNFQDDEHDAEKSVNAYNTLKDWGMQVLMGTVTSAPCVAVADKTNADNMFQITPSGSSVECAQNPNVFRVCFSDPDQGAASATYIAENKLAEKIAVIYDSSDVYSSGIYEKFAAEAANQGLEIVDAEAFTADSNKDFSTQLQKAKDAGADLVFLPIYYTEASLILKQADTMGYAPKFFGCDGMDGILQVENFDTKLAEGLMLLTPFAADAQDELTQKFVTSYKENYGETPIQFAADAYDAIYAIKAAMEEADITPETSVSDTCDKMKEAMLKIKVNGLTGEDMTWTEDGEPHKAPKAVKVVDGAYQAM
ncbi:amino acid ABC transporter substrate-binding protein [Clostridiaceae bacterium AF02-42]|uniref:ABC transporter substrate-binding protein n=1 Tax=Clostridium sp. AF28-12 TaxID=2305241 RepID=UPI000E3F20B6|nr:ABC transporter substrate-binding protein [Clostridium sp. AF28-12]RGD99262.1 amino acid ABC transporter substrate-binding protein [Clostridium sp. AF28-12]RGE04259.1 amino acid ABC transporter substrate-binding protein [Clostridiaceae bacterium AF02-42]